MSYDTLVTLFSVFTWFVLALSLFAFPFLGLVLVWFRWFKYRSSASHPRLELFNNIVFTLFDLCFGVAQVVSIVRNLPDLLNS